MAKFNDVLISLLEKVGMSEQKGKIEKLLELEDEIPDDIATPLMELLTLKAAKNNPKLKLHYVGEYLHGSEKVLETAIKESGLSEEEQAEILSVQKFTDRSVALTEALKKKVSQPNKKVDDVTTKYNELQSQFEAFKKSHIPKEDLEKFRVEVENERYSSAISDLSNSFNWSDSFDLETRPIVFSQLLEKKVNEIGAKIVLKDRKPVLVQKDNPELNYFDNSNKEVTLAELAKNLAVEKKLIAASGSTTPPSPGTTPVIKTEPIKQKSSGINTVVNLVDDSLKPFLNNS